MDMDHLEEFTVLANTLSFSEAAKVLNMSQSSLSKHIRALEEELDITLFDRTSRTVTLSSAGRKVLPYAEVSVGMANKIRNLCLEQNGKSSKKASRHILNIASVPIMAAYGTTELLAVFQRFHPEITIHTSEYEPVSIPDLLDKGQCDLAFMRESPELVRRYDFLPFVTENIVAVLPESHPLAKEEHIRLEQLRGEKKLMISEQAYLHRICIDLCSDAGFAPDIIYTGTRPENIINMIAQGMGVTLFSERFFQFYNKPGTSCVAVTPTAVTRMGLVRNKRGKISYPARLFWDYILVKASAGWGPKSTA